MEPESHLLHLKVMRLTRPRLSSTLPITCDSYDLPGNLLSLAAQQDPTTVKGTENLALGDFLLTPQNPVDMFLGETFSSYVVVYSETDQTVFNVNVKIELQTASQRLPLATKPTVSQLGTDETVNILIHHEVKELGTHILVCEVEYQSPTKLVRTFRKFFKIQVLKPLDVKTKFYNADNDDIYLEAQVQNITGGTICLEKVELESAHLFKVNPCNDAATGKSIYNTLLLVPPDAICQFLYCLTPNEKLLNDLKALVGATNVGKLDIVWRSNMGEKGRLHTSQLQRQAPQFGDLRIQVIDVPNFVVLENVFSFKCKLFNNSERSIDLILYLESTEAIAWCGVSGRKLDPFPPNSQMTLEFNAVPLVPGLQEITGIKLVDTFLKTVYSREPLAEVFVTLNDKEVVDFVI